MPRGDAKVRKTPASESKVKDVQNLCRKRLAEDQLPKETVANEGNSKQKKSKLENMKLNEGKHNVKSKGKQINNNAVFTRYRTAEVELPFTRSRVANAKDGEKSKSAAEKIFSRFAGQPLNFEEVSHGKETDKGSKLKEFKIVNERKHNNMANKGHLIPDTSEALIGDGIEVMVDTNEFGPSEDDNSDISDVESIADEEFQQMSDPYAPLDITELIPVECVGTGGDQQIVSTGTVPAGNQEKLAVLNSDESTICKVFEQLLNETLGGVKGNSNKPGKNNRNNYKPKETPLKGNNNKEIGAGMQQVKSPSDTTLYAPAICRTVEINKQNEDKDEKISDFVESMRFQSATEGGPLSKENRVTTVNTVQEPQPSTSSGVRSVPPEFEAAKKKTHNAIIEAEKFRATVADPAGMNEVMFIDPAVGMMAAGLGENSGRSDDGFFHLMCHIDPHLREKIERGEYVDLEKLLLKDKTKNRLSDDTRLEWVHRYGGTFLMPAADRDHKITSIRRWDQAFRVYATIYCGANPHRVKEIWQYISVINTGAASYMWDNVASYDYTFRHLMEFNPKRSWVMTYNQMWNLSMKDPISKNMQSKNFQTAGSKVTTPNSKPGLRKNSSSRPRYCWFFNRGEKCKYGPNCRFVERCSYCDSVEHAVLACQKLTNKKD